MWNSDISAVHLMKNEYHKLNKAVFLFVKVGNTKQEKHKQLPPVVYFLSR